MGNQWFNIWVHNIVAAVEDLRSDITAHADPQRAAAQRAYLKNSWDHLGLSVPQLRRLVRGWARMNVIVDHDDVWTAADLLQPSPIYEFRAAAVELLAYRSRVITLTDAEALRFNIASARTWALVDPLSTDVVGQIVHAYPVADWTPILTRWSTDDSFWVRRSSMLSQLKWLRDPQHDASLFFGFADQMAAEREFFIRKVIGWVLRDMSKTRADEVYAWVLPRADRLSGVTLREATKYLTERQRQKIQVRRG